MKIHEYQGKQIFARYNIPIPKGYACFSAKEAREAATKLKQETGSELCVVIAMLLRYERPPLDRRNVAVIVRSVGIAAVVLVVSQFLSELGIWRLLPVMLLYLALAFALRVIRVSDIARAIALVKAQRRT